jgi:lipoate-protein ligase A
LPYAEADGAANMAADEALVRSAIAGVASLRFYGWTMATMSLGYFQPASVRHADPSLAMLPWVRRPSGGATLVHHHELTYAIALPPGPAWQMGEPWLLRMHRIIAVALAGLGLGGQIETVGDVSIRHGDILCFQQFTPGDLLSGGKKVVGSAQRKHRLALMQHGSILLAQSACTPSLPGIRETTGLALTVAEAQEAILLAFRADTGWFVETAEWTTLERESIRELTAEKYATAAWNGKR